MAGKINTTNPSPMISEALEYQRQLGEIARQYASQRGEIKAEYDNIESIMSSIIEGMKSKNKSDQKRYEELFNSLKETHSRELEKYYQIKTMIDSSLDQITDTDFKKDIDKLRQTLMRAKTAAENVKMSEEIAKKWEEIEAAATTPSEKAAANAEKTKAEGDKARYENLVNRLKAEAGSIIDEYGSSGITAKAHEIDDDITKLRDKLRVLNDNLLAPGITPKKIEKIEKEIKETENKIDRLEEKKKQLDDVSVAVKNINELSELSDNVHKAGEGFGKLGEQVEETNRSLENTSILTGAIVSAINAAWGAMKKFGKEVNEVWNYYDQISHQQGRSYGMLGEEMDKYRVRLMQIAIETGDKFGLAKEEVAKLQDDYINATGKVRLLDRQAIQSVAAMSKLTSPEIAKSTIEVFDKFGGSAEVAMASAYSTYEMAAKAGLNASKTSDAFVKNMGLAQTMTFANGVDGVRRMTVLSETLKFNMQDVARASEKFSNISDAIKTSANLQMLGGSFAMNFGNPLDALYESLNDMEGFTTRVTDMWKGKGTFNAKTGMVETSGYDKALIRESANAIGMDMGEAMKIVTQQVRNERIDSELNSYVRNNLTEEQKMAIYNKSQWDVTSGTHKVTYMTDNGIVSKSISEITPDEIGKIMTSGSVDNINQNVFDIAGNVRALTNHLIGRAVEAKSWNEKMTGVDTRFKAESAKSYNRLKAPIDKEVGDVIDGNSVFSPVYNWFMESSLITKMALIGIGTAITTGIGVMVKSFGKDFIKNMVSGNGRLGRGIASLRRVVAQGFSSIKAKMSMTTSSPSGPTSGGGFGWKGLARWGGGAALIAGGLYAMSKYRQTQDDIKSGKVTLGGSDDYSVLQGGLSGAGIGAGIGTMILPGWGTAIGGALGGVIGAASANAKRHGMMTSTVGDGKIYGETQSMDPSELTASNTNNMLSSIDSSRNILSGIAGDTRKISNIMYANQTGGVASPLINRYTSNMSENNYVMNNVGGANIRNIARTRANMSSVGDIVTNENMGSSVIIPKCDVVKVEPKSIDYVHPTVAPVEDGSVASVHAGKIEVEPIKIDISGKISLDGGSSTAEIDVEKLLNTPGFKNKLVEIINQKIIAMTGDLMTNNQALMARRGTV